MSRIRIYGFLFDEDNEDKFAAHNVSPLQVYQLLQNEHVVVRNRKGRAASHLIIGIDDNSICIAIPIRPTTDPTIWRPITAWRCKDSEKARLDKAEV